MNNSPQGGYIYMSLMTKLDKMAHPQLNQKTVEYIIIALLDCACGFGGSIQGVAQAHCNYND
jgi:hypothetical protein